jgi:hypothetical protein
MDKGQTINVPGIIKLVKSKQGVLVESGKSAAPQNAPSGFKMYKAIQDEKSYHRKVQARNNSVRKYLEESCQMEDQRSILPGQMIMFDYFEPKMKDELEYYDAKPVTIFFNIIETPLGRRVLGFNLHYYPPRIRWFILDRIFEIFKPLYSRNWNQSLSKELYGFDYRFFMEQLEEQGLSFGVRMYDPELMKRIKPIPVNLWPKAAYTEGMFRKRTRDQILHYWQNEYFNIKKRMALNNGSKKLRTKTNII